MAAQHKPSDRFRELRTSCDDTAAALVVLAETIESIWGGQKEPQPLTVREAALRLKCSEATIYNLIKRGDLASLKIGTGRGTLRIRPESLDALDREPSDAICPWRTS